MNFIIFFIKIHEHFFSENFLFFKKQKKQQHSAGLQPKRPAHSLTKKASPQPDLRAIRGCGLGPAPARATLPPAWSTFGLEGPRRSRV